MIWQRMVNKFRYLIIRPNNIWVFNGECYTAATPNLLITFYYQISSCFDIFLLCSPWITHVHTHHYPDSKVHGANMGPIWGRQDPGGPHVGPMDFAIGVYMYTIQIHSFGHFVANFDRWHAKGKCDIVLHIWIWYFQYFDVLSPNLTRVLQMTKTSTCFIYEIDITNQFDCFN